MCLFLNNPFSHHDFLEEYDYKSFKATEDIIVYKTLLQFPNGELKTVVRYSPVIIGATYVSKLTQKENRVHVGLHSFAYFPHYSHLDLKNVYIGFDNREFLEKVKIVVAKCKIPVGSDVYHGYSLFGEHNYASNRLQYLEIVDHEL